MKTTIALLVLVASVSTQGISRSLFGSLSGRYNANRYTGGSGDGRYTPDNSGAYNKNDGKYHPDESGKYVHSDVKYQHADDKYKHTADKFGNNGGNFGGSGGNGGFGPNFGSGNSGNNKGSGQLSGSGIGSGLTSGIGSQLGSGIGSGLGSGSGSGIGSGILSSLVGSGIGSGLGSGSRTGIPSRFGSGSNSNIGSGISTGAGFGAPVALQQGSAAGKYDNRNYGIIRKVEKVESDGYHYLYETENGILGEEEGKLANRGTDEEAMRASGFFTYTGPDNIVYTVRYTADENGFVPDAAHLPTPPPIPSAIQRALDYQRSVGTL